LSNIINNNDLIIYETEDGLLKLVVIFEDENVWVNQKAMAELFQTTVPNVNMHIKNVYEEKELNEDSTIKDFLIVQKEGNRSVERNVAHYNLDVIISVGYRVKSLRGTQFRQWATKLINEYIRKGFILDDARLKQGGNRYFKELLQRIRDIRSSERNFYQQVTDIYATAIDYDKSATITRDFFATVQNKMHYAAHKQTAAEVVYNRVDAKKINLGMTNFEGDYITKSDIGIAKNYLTEKELQILNILVSGFLDFAELQAIEQKTMKMIDWIVELDRHLAMSRREILTGKGNISQHDAKEKAEKEYEKYRAEKTKLLVSDFDKATKRINRLKTDSEDE